MRHILTFILIIAAISTFGQIIYTGNDAIKITQDSVTIQAGPYRGNIQWQTSHDSVNWINLEGEITDSIIVSSKTEAVYRAVITEGKCLPVYSDTVSIVFTVPVVITSIAEDITTISALLGGSIINDGGTRLIERGICYSLTPHPTINDRKNLIGNDINSFNDTISGLASDTIYYVRAYGINSKGVGYGNEVSFITTTLSNCIVYTNITDPRLVEIQTPDRRNTIFFGQRDAVGKPIKLTGYSITSLIDSTKSDIVTLDSEGRYSNIFLGTGEKLHLDYGLNDSVTFILSELDGESNQNNIEKKGMQNNYLKIYNSTYSKKEILGADNNIDIKITAKNRITQIEKDVKNEETAVFVNIKAGKEFNKSIQAVYNNTTGFYNMPLSLTGLNYQDESALDKTLELVKNALDVACKKTSSGDKVTDVTIPVLIATSICPIPHPAAKAICLASEGILFACNINGKVSKASKILNKVLDPINSVIYKIDPNAIQPTDGIVTVTSLHSEYGKQNSTPTTVKQILSDLNNYDIQITHEYTEKTIPSLTTILTSVDSTLAISGGTILNDGGDPIIAKGVCWNTSQNPTIANFKTMDGSGLGNFTSNITGLVPDSKYYVRAYATNSKGTAYGNMLTIVAGWCRFEVLWSQPHSGWVTWRTTGTNEASFAENIIGTWTFCVNNVTYPGVTIGQILYVKPGHSLSVYQWDDGCPEGNVGLLGTYTCPLSP